MVSMRDLFPDGAQVSKASLRRHLRGPVANVQGFGARGDDMADDTAAIQAAVEHVEASGGGVVYLPAGTYRIMPQRSIAGSSWRHASALVISGDNVTLQGDGPALTRVRFRTRGDGDPTDDFEHVTWRAGDTDFPIWRGTAVYVSGGLSAARARRNVTIADMEIDGGAYPGNTRRFGAPIPSDPELGWDISHKGILLEADRHIRGVVLRNLHLHNFRGEVIYGGGKGIDDVVIEDCHIHATSADGISISAGQVIRNNRIEDVGHACVESFHFSREARYQGNSFSHAKLGLNLQTDWNAATPALISGNVFTECEQNGILFNVENGPTVIADNLIVDCGFYAAYGAAIRIEPGRATGSPVVTGIVVRGNTLLRKARSGGMGIMLGCSAGGTLRSVLVTGNFIGSDTSTPARKYRFLAPVAYGFDPGASVAGIMIRRNVYFHTQRHAENMLADNKLGAPMPSMRDNEIIDAPDGANSVIVTDGVAPSRFENEGPIQVLAAEAGSDPTPVLVPGDYEPGQEFLLFNGDARHRVYFPQASTLYQCREGRYLVPGVELRLRCDGERFVESAFVDCRGTSFAEVTEGAVIDCAGHHECYLAPPAMIRFARFAGIGHGTRVRLVAANRNVVIACNDIIRTRDDADLALAEGAVAEFLRTRDGVLRQI